MREQGEIFTAVVTGVGRRRGIAAAVCRALVREGWHVSASGWPDYDSQAPWTDQALDDLRPLTKELQASGRFDWRPLDLSSPSAARELFESINDDGRSVAALVVVHARSLAGGLLEVTPAEFDHHVAVNARGTLLLIQEFARRWRDDIGIGRILTFISSPPLGGELAYAASKGALEWLTLSAAADLAPRGITVNAIAPGPIDTGWMSAATEARIRDTAPFGRAASPDDVAELVAFLCSERGRGITGQVIHCDGGWSTLRG
ncbi:MAG: SDR family oxidoreductase [Candidatus Dormibacteraeota bacterium]|nr:SDR family oxidoreductase [Candidatus Dormibacteraeota bacterium]